MTATLLPLVSLAMASSTAGGAVETVTSPRTAQVRLAECLASADGIDAVTANRREITFAIDRAGDALRVVATVDAHGQVAKLSITNLGHGNAERGALSWLTGALADTTAVTALAVDRDGRVTLATADARTYLLIPGHDPSATNMAVEAMWAAAWDADS